MPSDVRALGFPAPLARGPCCVELPREPRGAALGSIVRASGEAHLRGGDREGRHQVVLLQRLWRRRWRRS